MLKSFFSLKIYTEQQYHSLLTTLLKNKIKTSLKYSIKLNTSSRILEIIQEEYEGEYFDFINFFLDLLEGSDDIFISYNINVSDILILWYYEYSQQCNIEFEPKTLKRLGNKGIKLCISCMDMSS